MVDFSGGVKYAPETGAFFLTSPAIERLSIRGIPGKYSEKVTVVVSKALEEYYANHPIYLLKATDIKQVAAKIVLRDVAVEKKELIVTLGI